MSSNSHANWATNGYNEEICRLKQLLRSLGAAIVTGGSFATIAVTKQIIATRSARIWPAQLRKLSSFCKRELVKQKFHSNQSLRSDIAVPSRCIWPSQALVLIAESFDFHHSLFAIRLPKSLAAAYRVSAATKHSPTKKASRRHQARQDASCKADPIDRSFLFTARKSRHAYP